MADGEADAVSAPAKNSDLPVRAASAVVMLVIAGAAFLAGGRYLDAFIAVVALLTIGELVRLVWRATKKTPYRMFGVIAGTAYVFLAALALGEAPAGIVFFLVATVVMVDTFAYFSGRTFGGPKIAPRISPSKTWAGLIGGALGASAFSYFWFQEWPRSFCAPFLRLVDEFPRGFDHRCDYAPWPFSVEVMGQLFVVGLLFAVIAQSGDFLESWLKRKAGMKDSSNLIPGHGGVFDRTDGLIAVAFVFGVFSFFL